MKINPTTMVTTHHVELDDEELGFLALMMGYTIEREVTSDANRLGRGKIIRDRLLSGLEKQRDEVNKIRQAMGLANIGF